MSVELRLQTQMNSHFSCAQLTSTCLKSSVKLTLSKWCRSLSHYYRRKGALYKALNWCARAMTLCPENGKIHCEMGTIYLQLNLMEDARLWFDEAHLATYPAPSEWLHFNNGCFFEALGLWPKAFVEYKQAFSINPAYWQACLAVDRLKTTLN